MCKRICSKNEYIKNVCKITLVIKTIFLTFFKAMSELETCSLITFLKLFSSSIQSISLIVHDFKLSGIFTSDGQCVNNSQIIDKRINIAMFYIYT